VHTLNEKRIEFGYFLSTDPKRKFGRARVVRFKETGVTGATGHPDVCGFDPDVTEKITLRAQGDNNFVTRSECTHVIKTFGFDGKISMTFVILVKERYLGVAGDEYILGTLRYEIDQRSRHLLINDIKILAL
tara:strand:- start:5696 stop:6091 length:396 start_codon:yes stop_codon:yes gene_type:complete